MAYFNIAAFISSPYFNKKKGKKGWKWKRQTWLTIDIWRIWLYCGWYQGEEWLLFNIKLFEYLHKSSFHIFVIQVLKFNIELIILLGNRNAQHKT
jgi:hypothetical protein